MELATKMSWIDKCRVCYWLKPYQDDNKTADYINFDKGHKRPGLKVSGSAQSTVRDPYAAELPCTCHP